MQSAYLVDDRRLMRAAVVATLRAPHRAAHSTGMRAQDVVRIALGCWWGAEGSEERAAQASGVTVGVFRSILGVVVG